MESMKMNLQLVETRSSLLPTIGTTPADLQLKTQYRHIFLVTGPAGCGKTTVAQHIAAATGMPYLEGDAHHPAANVQKMRSGTALSDTDRWDWLTALREETVRRLNDCSSAVIVTCSALKRKYRDVIRVAGYYDSSVLVHFLYLKAPVEIVARRVALRQNHYMGEKMVQGQFDILEQPTADEPDVTSFDTNRALEEVQADVLARVQRIFDQAKR